MCYKKIRFEPYKIVSLWDMIAPYAYLFSSLNHQITDVVRQLERQCEGLPNGGRVNMSDLKDSELWKTLISIKGEEAFIDLPGVKAQIERIESHLKQEHLDKDEAITSFRELGNRFHDDLRRRLFFHVPDDKIRYYDKAEMLFSEDVIKAFPGIIDDVEEAGACLAFGRATACVLHLMRVMESGLKHLGKELNIDYAPSWDSYLGRIQKEISRPHKEKSAEWKRSETFYRDLSGDLLTVKQAWRNPTMHVGRKYGPEEAEEIFRAVRNFMKKIAAPHLVG